MTGDFNGWVLRKPRVAASNANTTAEPDVVVREQDEAAYRASYLDNVSATGSEYLVRTAQTGDLVVPSSITEIASPFDGSLPTALVFTFNTQGRAVAAPVLPADVTPLPDSVDTSAGLITYLVAPGVAPTVTFVPAPLSVEYTRNDSGRTRFGYDARVSRWETLPGGSPESLGLVPETGLLTLPLVEADAAGAPAPPRVLLGNPDRLLGTLVDVTQLLGEDAFADYRDGILDPASGEGALNVETGELRLAPSLTVGFEAQEAFFTRRNFFAFDASTGRVGIIGEDLLLNPLPLVGEEPLLRVGYGSYLNASVGAGSPVGSEQARVDPLTGRVNLSAALEAQSEGLALYYDGVLTGTATPQAPTVLGDLLSNQSGLSNVDLLEYEPEALVLYIEQTGEAVRELEFVADPSDFTEARNLPPTKAQVARSDGSVRLSQRFVSANLSRDLVAGSTDLTLERGLTFRMGRSPLDPTNAAGLPDGQGVLRLEDELLGPVRSGPSAFLTQVPLVDVAGYAADTFYRLGSGAQRRVLVPDEEVIYDFDTRQLLWAQRRTTSQTISQRTFSVRVPDQVLLNRNYSFELNRGSGFEALEDGVNASVDFDIGEIRFTQTQGEVLIEDVATVAGQEFTFLTEDLSGVVISLVDLDRPLLRTGLNAYTITGIAGSVVTVEGDVQESGSVAVEIISAPEPVYAYALAQVNLNPDIVAAFLVREVDSSGTVYAPGTTGEVYAVSGGVRRDVVRLASTVLGEAQDALTLPAFAQGAEAVFEIYLGSDLLVEVGGTPNQGEYRIMGVDLVLSSADVLANPKELVTLDPSLSTARATGDVELLVATRELGFPLDLAVVDLYVQVEARIQDRLLYFSQPFAAGDRLRARYRTADEVEVEEEVGFRVVEDAVIVSATEATYGAGRLLDPNRAPIILVNGARTDLPVDPVAGTINTSSVRTGRTISVSYAALDAKGGEQTASLLQTPVSPDVVFAPGTSQTLRGDQTDDLFLGAFVQAGSTSFTVASVPTYDGTQTTFEVEPSLPQEVRNPITLVSGTVFDFEVLPTLAFDAPVQGSTTLRVFSDVTGLLKAQRVLVLDSDAYYVTDVTFDGGQTVLSLASPLARAYSSPLASQSVFTVYGPGAQVLLTEKTGLDGGLVEVIRRAANGDLTVVDPSTYLFEPAGRLTLDPTLTAPLSRGEVVFLRYTALDPVGPTTLGGQLFLPRFRGTYTQRVNASETNGYLGSNLYVSATLRAPDTFYFRVLPLAEWSEEVAQGLTTSSGTGPVVSSFATTPLSDQGIQTLVGEGGDLYDTDRAARRYLSFYNDLVTAFENVQEVLDGRVIGDRDGKFRFTVRADSTPGGEDPITGRLLPYYINPANPGVRPTSVQIGDTGDLTLQTGLVQNNLDDILLTSKRPFSLNILGFTIDYTGTFKRAWEPSRLSRLYPEESTVQTITVPPLGGGGSYTFGDDGGQILADSGVTGVLAIKGIRPRGSAATVTKVTPGDPLVLSCAQTYDPITGDLSNAPYDLTTGDPSRARPPFEVGSRVDIGRVVFSRNGEDVTRTEVLVARDLVVDSVTASTLELVEGAGTAIGSVNTRAGDTVYEATPLDLPGVADLASLDPADMPFYRNPLDVTLDGATGEVINPTLPGFFATLLGQKVPPPGTLLDLTVSYQNTNTSPRRPPALDGGAANDDGDLSVPFVSPMPDSELSRLPAELAAITTLLSNTEPGVYVSAATRLSATTLSTSLDLTGLGVGVQGFTLLEGSPVVYSSSEVPGPNVLTLAAFEYEDLTAPFEVPDLFAGSGTVAGAVLTDAGTDFTAFSGATITLNIDGGASYPVSVLSNGSLTATGVIAETGAQSYTLSASGVGSISTDLTTLEAPGVDFTSASGPFTVARPFNGGLSPITFLVGEGSDGSLVPDLIPSGFNGPLAVGPLVPVASGTAQVSVTNVLSTLDSLASVAPGDTLIIASSSPNAGRYRVGAVGATTLTLDVGADASIWNTFFWDNEGGGITYPVDYTVVRPRRYSVEMEDYREELARQRVIYEDNANAPADIIGFLTATSSNPATPLKERLDALDALLLPAPFLTLTGVAETGAQTLTGGVDFVVEGVETGDLVRVDAGINRGFYFVTGVSSAAITLDGSNPYVTYTLSNDGATDYTVTKAEGFQDLTYQLVLSEIYGLDQRIERLDAGIRGVDTDTDDLLGVLPYGSLTGDYTDDTLTAHQTQAQARLDRLQVVPTLAQDIEGILKGSEALYDTRYAWVDYRANLETGTLPRIRRYLATVDKEKERRLRELTRAGST